MTYIGSQFEQRNSHTHSQFMQNVKCVHSAFRTVEGIWLACADKKVACTLDTDWVEEYKHMLSYAK
jgi:nitrate reductase alpha subunit